MPLLPLQVAPRYSASDHRGGISADIIGWDDLQGSIQAGSGVSALTTEAFRDTPFRMSFFRSGQNDALSFVYQLPHTWQPGTIVRPHIHVLPMADPASPQNVRFIGQWAWASGALALPANSGWIAFTADLTINPGDVFLEKVADFTGGLGITPPAGIVESDLLFVFLERNGGNAADTYNTSKSGGTPLANLGLLSADVHFQTQKPGGSQSELLG